MISIDGLTKKQAAFLKIIWAFDDEEKFQYWFVSLPFEDKLTVESLLEILKYEVLEDTIGLFKDDADEVLRRFINGNV